jgi:hypothetical protein
MGMVGLPTLAFHFASGAEPYVLGLIEMNSFKVFKSHFVTCEDTTTQETTSRIVWESNPSVTFAN